MESPEEDLSENEECLEEKEHELMCDWINGLEIVGMGNGW